MNIDRGATMPPIGAVTGVGEGVLMPDVGCKHKCSFCELTYFFQHQEHPLADVLAEVDRLHDLGVARVKINSATASQYSGIRELLEYIKLKKMTVGFGSVRIDEMRDDFLSRAAPIMGYTKTNYIFKAKKPESGKALHFGVEFGSDRMFQLMRKGLRMEEILKQFEALANFGIDNVGLYFIVGVPGETNLEHQGIIQIVEAAAAKCTQVYVNINPLISSPQTPVQRFENISLEEYQELLAYFRGVFSSNSLLSNRAILTSLDPGHYLYEILTMRSDRRIAPFIEAFHSNVQNYSKLTTKLANSLLKDSGLPEEAFFRRRISSACLPWELIQSQAVIDAERSLLRREREIFGARALTINSPGGYLDQRVAAGGEDF